MSPSLTVIDDFFPTPDEIRKFALEHDFDGGVEMHGHTYPGTVKPKLSFFQTYLVALLQNVIGRQIDMAGCAFVCGKEGQFTEQWIHADPMGKTHAAVVYLFDDHHEHGTAFWRHREADETFQNQNFYDRLGVDIKEPEQCEALVARLLKEGESEDAWQMAGFTEAKFNRLIFYPSTMFHSRYPRHAFGTGPADGRLVLVAFFDIL